MKWKKGQHITLKHFPTEKYKIREITKEEKHTIITIDGINKEITMNLKDDRNMILIKDIPQVSMTTILTLIWR